MRVVRQTRLEVKREQTVAFAKGVKFLHMARHSVPGEAWVKLTYEEPQGVNRQFYTLYALRHDFPIPGGAEYLGTVGNTIFYIGCAE